MQLSASLTLLALLAAPHRPAVASGRPAALTAAALRRRLARNEVKAAGGGRSLYGRTGGTPASSPTSGGYGGNRGGNIGAVHHVDAGGGNAAMNIYGVTLVRDDRDDDSIAYQDCEPVNVAFEVLEDELGVDVLAGLDGTKVVQWTVGLFMHMSKPQGGSLPPIVAVNAGLGGRRLQGKDSDEANGGGGPGSVIGGDVDPYAGGDFSLEENGGGDGDASPYRDGGAAAATVPPALPLAGTATFAATDAVTLDYRKYGTGFDAYLLDERGAVVVGPAYFTMNGNACLGAAVDVKQVKGAAAGYGLVRMEAAQRKRRKAPGSGTAGAQGGAGVSGIGGEKSNGSTGGMLATYLLETDKAKYDHGERVVVTYDIEPDMGAGGLDDGLDSGKVRRLAQDTRTGQGGGEDRQLQSEACVDVATNCRTDRCEDYTERKLLRCQQTCGLCESVSPSQSPIAKTTTTTAATTAVPDAPPADTTAAATQAPPADTTAAATAATTTIDMGAGPEEEVDMTGEIIGRIDPTEEEIVVIDPTDVTLYTIAVFMQNARSQGGKLTPKVAVPLCARPPCAAADVLRGTVEFQADNELGPAGNENGYSVWVLNGAGGEVAGPLDFVVL